ncbi:hypothetical protein ACHAWF_003856 [Thalassiosira exigua]
MDHEDDWEDVHSSLVDMAFPFNSDAAGTRYHPRKVMGQAVQSFFHTVQTVRQCEFLQIKNRKLTNEVVHLKSEVIVLEQENGEALSGFKEEIKRLELEKVGLEERAQILQGEKDELAERAQNLQDDKDELEERVQNMQDRLNQILNIAGNKTT